MSMLILSESIREMLYYSDIWSMRNAFKNGCNTTIQLFYSLWLCLYSYNFICILFCFVYFLCIIHINVIRKWWLSFRFKLHLVILIELCMQHMHSHVGFYLTLASFAHSFSTKTEETIVAWNQLFFIVYMPVTWCLR